MVHKDTLPLSGTPRAISPLKGVLYLLSKSLLSCVKVEVRVSTSVAFARAFSPVRPERLTTQSLVLLSEQGESGVSKNR